MFFRGKFKRAGNLAPSITKLPCHNVAKSTKDFVHQTSRRFQGAKTKMAGSMTPPPTTKVNTYADAPATAGFAPSRVQQPLVPNPTPPHEIASCVPDSQDLQIGLSLPARQPGSGPTNGNLSARHHASTSGRGVVYQGPFPASLGSQARSPEGDMPATSYAGPDQCLLDRDLGSHKPIWNLQMRAQAVADVCFNSIARVGPNSSTRTVRNRMGLRGSLHQLRMLLGEPKRCLHASDDRIYEKRIRSLLTRLEKLNGWLNICSGRPEGDFDDFCTQVLPIVNQWAKTLWTLNRSF
ncbi:hypothetical protein P691DRAFT_811419 [Macrolepiota fuliginosa MF-IS2]|uniref:Uncharacterized protein n=1 Tax=Macrolepiota fuliginosa MF-IS2 TaxID=1400762 RepID=A0A9P6C641_9AGAR|nr:hypothetical protein P691DRAFT_811419 [Macrolepiota fuliginosa MF-IS2]